MSVRILKPGDDEADNWQHWVDASPVFAEFGLTYYRGAAHDDAGQVDIVMKPAGWTGTDFPFDDLISQTDRIRARLPGGWPTTTPITFNYAAPTWLTDPDLDPKVVTMSLHQPGSIPGAAAFIKHGITRIKATNTMCGLPCDDGIIATPITAAITCTACIAELDQDPPARLEDIDTGINHDHTQKETTFTVPLDIVAESEPEPEPAGPAPTAWLGTFAEHRWLRTANQTGRDLIAGLKGVPADTLRWPPRWLWPAALFTVAVAYICVMVLATMLVSWLGTTFAGATTIATDDTVTQAILTPIRGYLTTHSAGLPVTAATAFTVWAAWGCTSWLWSLATRNTGARLAWIVFGAASIAMVYAASPAPATNRTVAAGIAALYWLFLSTAALRRRWSRPAMNAHLRDVPTRAKPTATPDTTGNSLRRDQLDPDRDIDMEIAARFDQPDQLTDWRMHGTWEDFLVDVGAPRMTMVGRYPTDDVDGFVLHYLLPSDGRTTAAHIGDYARRMEVRLGRRFSALFTNGIVPVGCVRVDSNFRNGQEIADEVLVYVTTAPLRDASYAACRPHIIDILLAAGPDGATPKVVNHQLQRLGFRFKDEGHPPMLLVSTWLSVMDNDGNIPVTKIRNSDDGPVYVASRLPNRWDKA